jgi:hypothetical protein
MESRTVACPDCDAPISVRTVATFDDVVICDECGGAVPAATVVFGHGAGDDGGERYTRRGVFRSLLGRAADRLPDV